MINHKCIYIMSQTLEDTVRKAMCQMPHSNLLKVFFPHKCKFLICNV